MVEIAMRPECWLNTPITLRGRRLMTSMTIDGVQFVIRALNISPGNGINMLIYNVSPC